MAPELQTALLALLVSGGGIVVEKLTSLRMAIREEAESQKALAIDAGIDQSQFTRKLHDKEPFTFRDLDKLPVPVQRAFHLREIERLGLPERVHSWLAIDRVVRREKRSA